MQPYLVANLAVLDELFDELAKLLQSFSDDAVNWAPLESESNTIAALVVHIAGSLDSWTARAVDEPIDRDRDAEFRARATVPDLLETIDRSRTTMRRRFALLDAIDPSTIRHIVRLSRGLADDVSVAWCVEHAVIHAGEHWGQIQLTSQLYGAPLSPRPPFPHEAGKGENGERR